MEAERSNGGSGESGPGGASGARPYAPPASAAEGPPDEAAFAGTCNATLIDWIQLVQLGRRDAVLTVRSDKGKRAILWCRDGNIIDACCDGRVGEAAVYRLLAWQRGTVSVDFSATDHRRAIDTPTTGLLIEAMVRKDEANLDEPAFDDDSGGEVMNAEASPGPAAALLEHRLAWSLGITALLVVGAALGVAISRARAPARSLGAVTRAAPPAISVVPLPAPTAIAWASSRRRSPQPALRPSAAPPAALDQPAAPAAAPASLPGPSSRGGAHPANSPVAAMAAPPVDRGSPHRSVPGRSSRTSAHLPPTVGRAADKRQPSIRMIEDRRPQIRIIGEHEAHVDVLE